MGKMGSQNGERKEMPENQSEFKGGVKPSFMQAFPSFIITLTKGAQKLLNAVPLLESNCSEVWLVPGI